MGSHAIVRRIGKIYRQHDNIEESAEAATYRPVTAMKVFLNSDLHDDTAGKIITNINSSFAGKAFLLNGGLHDANDLALLWGRAEKEAPSVLVMSKLDVFAAENSVDPNKVALQVNELLTGLEEYESRNSKVLVVCLIGRLIDLHHEVRKSTLLKEHHQ